MNDENQRSKIARDLSSEEMLDELRGRGIELTSEKLAKRAVEFLLSTVRRLEAGDWDLVQRREWHDEMMRAAYAEEIHEKE